MDVEIADLDVRVARQDHRLGFTLDVQSFSGVAFGGRRVVVGGVVVSEDIGDDTAYIKPFIALQFGFPIFREGKFILQKSLSEKIADVRSDESRESLEEMKQELLFGISELFLNIVSKKRELGIMKQNMDRLDTVVEESRERLRNRLITNADFLEAEHQLSELKTDLYLVKLDLDLLQKQLANLIGMPLKKEFPEIKDDLSMFNNLNASIPDFDTIWNWAQEDNPNLNIANLDVEESKLSLRLAKTNIFPTLFLTETSAFSTDDSAHFMGLGIRFPIHEVFRRLIGDPDLTKRTISVAKSEINLQAVRSSVELELMHAYTDWKKAKETALNSLNKVKVREARVSEGDRRVREGLITLGNYLRFINSYNEALIEYEETKRNECVSLLTLLKNSGVIDRFVVQ